MAPVGITIDPKILGGIPVVTGTRIPVSYMLSALLTEVGDPLVAIRALYPHISREAIRAAIHGVINMLDAVSPTEDCRGA